MKRTEAPQRKTPLKRTGGPKPKRRRSREGIVDAAKAFRVTVCSEPCIVCGATDDLEAHHCVPAQALRRICQSLRLEDAEALAIIYDPGVGIALCNGCHGAHTSKMNPIPRSLLPERVFIAADEIGREAVIALEREHPDFDGVIPRGAA
jgi:hypothetical protein